MPDVRLAAGTSCLFNVSCYSGPSPRRAHSSIRRPRKASRSGPVRLPSPRPTHRRSSPLARATRIRSRVPLRSAGLHASVPRRHFAFGAGTSPALSHRRARRPFASRGSHPVRLMASRHRRLRSDRRSPLAGTARVLEAITRHCVAAASVFASQAQLRPNPGMQRTRCARR